MMVMPGSWLTIGRFLLLTQISCSMFMVMIAGIEYNLAERVMVVATGHTRLMLNMIDHTGHTGTCKSKHQRGAKHRTKPKKWTFRQQHHNYRA